MSFLFPAMSRGGGGGGVKKGIGGLELPLCCFLMAEPM